MFPRRLKTSLGDRSARKARNARTNRMERSRLIHREATLENLEERCLLTIWTAQVVPPAPLPVEGISFGTNSPTVATFASDEVGGANLTATVVFPSPSIEEEISTTSGITVEREENNAVRRSRIASASALLGSINSNALVRSQVMPGLLREMYLRGAP